MGSDTSQLSKEDASVGDSAQGVVYWSNERTRPTFANIAELPQFVSSAVHNRPNWMDGRMDSGG